MVFSRAQVIEFEQIIVEAFQKESFMTQISRSVAVIVAKQIESIVEVYEQKMQECKDEIKLL